MKIKRYEARTEQEAIEKVKEDLGLEALILNIKKRQPKGFLAFFRKPLVEVTAAYQEKEKAMLPPLIRTTEVPAVASSSGPLVPGFPAPMSAQPAPMMHGPAMTAAPPPAIPGVPAPTVPAPLVPAPPVANALSKEKEMLEQKQELIRALEERLNDRALLLEKALAQLSLSKHHAHSNRKYENNMVQVFYDALIEQGVDVEIAEKVLEEIGSVGAQEEIDLDMVVKAAYSNIMDILGSPESLKAEKANGNPKVVVFVGPTGVGKTTVIAKLTSIMILEKKLQVGLITADTYRIAAVEQLRTYADILGIEVGVIYSPEDLKANIDTLKDTVDIIFVDTAGRSHRNPNNLIELEGLLSTVPDSDKFLVLSTTTKCDDLINIVEAYSSVTDFRIIFTKLDETRCLGSMLNVCYQTGKKLSYVTNGQNVPDDIEVVQPEKITKALMGLEA